MRGFFPFAVLRVRMTDTGRMGGLGFGWGGVREVGG